MSKEILGLAYVVGIEACNIMLICCEIAQDVEFEKRNLATEGNDWKPATTTWYGSPNGVWKRW